MIFHSRKFERPAESAKAVYFHAETLNFLTQFSRSVSRLGVWAIAPIAETAHSPRLVTIFAEFEAGVTRSVSLNAVVDFAFSWA